MCVRACACVFMYVCMYVFCIDVIYICVCICTDVCMHLCMYIYTVHGKILESSISVTSGKQLKYFIQ